jgi:hypothetical protein
MTRLNTVLYYLGYLPSYKQLTVQSNDNNFKNLTV